MIKKPCEQCGAEATVIEKDVKHICAVCWLDQYAANWRKRHNDGQSRTKVSSDGSKSV
jgi:hypothetical protein